MTPTALIAEDEPLLARALAAQLRDAWPELDIVATVTDGDAAAEALARLAPTVAFLDIRMPGRSGLQAARAATTGTAVVFVTAYDQYAVEAFEQAAVDYLLKPLAPDRLATCIERLQRRIAAAAPATTPPVAAMSGAAGASNSASAPVAAPAGAAAPAIDAALLERLHALLEGRQGWLRFLRASLGDTIRQIPVDEVVYLEAQDKYVNVVTRDSQALVRVSLSELAQQLDPQRFSQIHRSTLVNLDAIDSIQRDFAGRMYVHLRGRSERLAVSRQYAAQFKGM